MSIINTFDEQPHEAVFGSFLTINASLAAQATFEANVSGNLAISATLDGGSPIETISSSLVIIAALSQGTDLAANISASLSIEAGLFIDPMDEYGMDIIVDILPADLDPELWLPRVKINGVEFPIVAGNYSEARDQVGGSLQVELVRPMDVKDVAAGDVVEFGIGKKISGVWDESTFETIMADGEITGTAFNIGGTPSNPSDNFTIRAISQSTSRLGHTPEETLVMYDSAMQTITDEEFRVLLDAEGRQYPTELKPVPNMKLSDVLREIYVTRLGYSSYRTNIPETQIFVPRIDFPLGQSYNSAINGFLGVYKPLIEEIDGIPWILDTTIELPEGFPAPRTITPGRYNSVAIQMNATKLDGVVLSYTENTRGYDFITMEPEVKLIASGSFGDPDYQETLVSKTYRVYRKTAYPTLELRKEMYLETQVTTSNVGTIGDTREEFSFDSMCRNYRRSKLTKSWLQDVDNAGDYDLMDSGEETEINTYAAHPFQSGAQIIAKTELRESGIILVDSENQQLGQAFEMPYDEADSKGNLTEGQMTRFGPIRTIIKQNQPQRNGMVRMDQLEIYHVRNKRVNHPSQEQPGDIAMNATAPEQNTTIVLADENATRSTGRLENLHAGPLPLTLAVPWARRHIKRRQAGEKELESSIERYHPGLVKGAVLGFDGRDYGSGADSLGFFIVTGRNIPFGNGFVNTNLVGDQVPTTSNFSLGPSNPSSGFNYAVASNSSITFEVPIDCVTGYELFAETVDTLTVEARKLGDVSWTDIETTPIDLTADAGLRVTYEIRLTAAVVTVLTRRIVKTRVKQA